MKKSFRPYHLIPAAVLLLIFVVMQGKPVQENHRAPTSIPKVKKHPHQFPPVQSHRSPSRGPASFAPKNLDLNKIVIPHPEIKMPRGNVLATNIGAIPLEAWMPGMAPLLTNDGVYGYYQKAPGEESIPVAFNPTTRRLRPISAVLHIRGVDEAQRETILKEGHQEFLYFKHLKRLSLKSSPEEVVKLHQAFGKRGYIVSLEVLERRPASH